MSFFDFFKRKQNRKAEDKKTPIPKKFWLPAEELKPLVTRYGACTATDKITVNGELVDYMYREEPINNADSGWRFFSGTETQEYIDNLDNTAFYAINTIANYDSAIIPYLNLPIGVALERVRGTNSFNMVPQ